MAGQCCRFMGQYDNAAYLLEKSISLNPNNHNNYFTLGVVYQQTKQYEKAIRNLKKSVELEPSYFPAYNSLGYTFKLLGTLNTAIKWYLRAETALFENALEIASEIEDRFSTVELGDGSKSLNVNVELMKNGEKVLKETLDYSIVQNNIGVCYMEQGNYVGAKQRFERSIAFIPLGMVYKDPLEHLESIQ